MDDATVEVAPVEDSVDEVVGASDEAAVAVGEPDEGSVVEAICVVAESTDAVVDTAFCEEDTAVEGSEVSEEEDGEGSAMDSGADMGSTH